PEVVHSQFGVQIIRNFLFGICGYKKSWTMENFIHDVVLKIRDEVRHDRVILGLSGGVDSSVAAALLSKAIGKKLTCIFVNNGLLRKNEEEEVRRAFRGRQLDLRVIKADKI